ncbi:MAG: hypothetical protein ABI434_15715 [Burkholderiaceae bacterium]
MHPSELFAPPRRQPSRWPAVAIGIIASVAAFVMLSLFVDALHQSIARGEALRASLEAGTSTSSNVSKTPSAEPENLQLAHR